MIIEPRIKRFEKLGFGMFVHFGLYSLLEKGEWVKHLRQIPDDEYEQLATRFNPDPNWAVELAATAKRAGCRYITLTTRHHDGFSLYDTRGLNTYDAPHALCGRDLVREFVDACRAEGIIPFFYHTLMDWYRKDYKEDFPAYLAYLRQSVEVLCTQYGEIGGLWFDGKWNKPDADWEEDALYALIRRHQPQAMIINNSGMESRGALGNIELDSVTFERGRPGPINTPDAPKYLASEMCQTMGDLWGCAIDDLRYKSVETLINDLCVCRHCGSNLLLNVGPMGNGLLRPLDAELLACMGRWVNVYDRAIRTPRPADIGVEGNPGDFVLQDGNRYYLFCHGLGMFSTPGTTDIHPQFDLRLNLAEPVKQVRWMDNDESLAFEQADGRLTVQATPFPYGVNLVVRVAEIETA